MRISLSEAKARLAELVRQADAGEEVVLTRHGRAVARIVAETVPMGRADRTALINAVRAASRAKALTGPDAARSQDFLYDEAGLPR